MESYVALLRGVNVSGKNKVSMPVLKESLLKYGFINVRTYINSGNIVFQTDSKDKRYLEAVFHEIIHNVFDLEIPVVVLNRGDMQTVIESSPSWWGTDNKEVYHNTIFMIPPTETAEVLDVLGDINPDREFLEVSGDTIYWSAYLKTYSKTRGSKIASTSVNQKVTIRNANTVRKLLEMVNDLVV